MAKTKRYTGVTLPGGYRVGEELGSGAFAQVYRATDSTGQPVAVKIATRVDEQATRRFYREIKVARALPPNPHCVAFRGAGETSDGRPWLAMEYVDGFTLSAVVAAGKPVPERAACALMIQLCEGFGGLHKLGLAHRDIKPDNIMITSDRRSVKLLDFGLVQDSQGLLRLFEEEDILQGRDFADDLDRGMIAGTPEYMAPEAISDPKLDDPTKQRTDTTADVYSLGVIFYQLLTGRKPFPFDTKAKDFKRYQKEVLAYLARRLKQVDEDLRRPPEINPALWTVIAKALRREPKLRQGDARVLLQDVERYAQTGAGIPEDEDVSATMAMDMSSIPGLKELQARMDEQGFGALETPEGGKPWKRPTFTALAPVRDGRAAGTGGDVPGLERPAGRPSRAARLAASHSKGAGPGGEVGPRVSAPGLRSAREADTTQGRIPEELTATQQGEAVKPDGGDPVWPWVLVGAVITVGLTVLVLVAMGVIGGS